MATVFESGLAVLIRNRMSHRVEFDPNRPVPVGALADMLEVARWAPTAHNMQNFEIVVVDDSAALAAIEAIHAEPSVAFIRENYRQLSFSVKELLRKGTGLLADTFPAEWLDPNYAGPATASAPTAARGAGPGRYASADPSAPAGRSRQRQMTPCPLLFVVLCDPGRRAPASEHDMLGMISLGCVMQNVWLTAEAHGLGVQVVSSLSDAEPSAQMHRILAIPEHLKIAYTLRVGYTRVTDVGRVRARRTLTQFVHRNRY